MIQAGAVPDARGRTARTGQTHAHRYLKPLLEMIERGDIDPSFVITHRISLDDAPDCDLAVAGQTTENDGLPHNEPRP